MLSTVCALACVLSAAASKEATTPGENVYDPDEEDLSIYTNRKTLKAVTKFLPEDCVDGAPRAAPGDALTVKYALRLTNGKSFQQTAEHSFHLGNNEVIQGWDEGLVGACLNELRRLYVPPHMGFGENRYAPDEEAAKNDPPEAEEREHLEIPPNSVLVFDVSVTQLIKKK